MKILFITSNQFDTQPNGGGIVSKRNLSLLQELYGKENVDSLCIKNNNIYKNIFVRAYYRINGYLIGLNKENVAEIIKKSVDYNIIFLDTSIYGILAYKLKKAGYKGKIFVFFHNIEYIFLSKINGITKIFSFLLLKPIKIVEQKSLQNADFIFSLNERDGKLIKKMYKKEPDYILPITLNDSLETKSEKLHLKGEKLTVLFFGSAFFANINGIKWFINNVLKNVDINLIIAGKGMSLLNKYSEDKKITVYDYIDDINDLYAKAHVVINPIFDGSGMKVKTCESLMMGKIILATPEALTGYKYELTSDIYVCKTDYDFIQTLKRLEQQEFSIFSDKNRELFETSYSHNVDYINKLKLSIDSKLFKENNFE